MKNIARWIIAGLIAAGTIGGAYLARAGVTCSLPFQLQNNTTADATQVMANYNALVTCLGNAAAAGANNDITSLNALSTPISPASGGSTVYIGGTSTGSANTQVVASTTPIGFSLTAGKRVTFIAGFSNTGAASLNVNATGSTNFFRRTQLGVSAMVGGELVAGQLIEAVFDGTQFQLLGPVITVGAGADWFTSTAPTGWGFRDGSAISRTTYADLFSLIGTFYGAGDGLTTFNVPDERGRVAVMKDGAGRISASCAGSNTLGAACGNTNGQAVLGQTNVPNYNLNLGGVTSSAIQGRASAGTPVNGGSTNQFLASDGTGGGVSQSAAIGGLLPSGGSGTAFSTTDPSLIVNKIIKY